MSTGVKVKALLAANPAVTAVVGDRIFPNIMPPETPLPALVYLVVDNIPQTTFTSVAATVVGSARVQVDAYDLDYDTAQALADAVSDCLDGVSVPELAALELNSRDMWDSELRAHRVSRDFSVWCAR